MSRPKLCAGRCGISWKYSDAHYPKERQRKLPRVLRLHNRNLPPTSMMISSVIWEPRRLQKGKKARPRSALQLSASRRLLHSIPIREILISGRITWEQKPGEIPTFSRRKFTLAFTGDQSSSKLDRVGSGDGFDKDLNNKEKAQRVKDLLSAIKNLWASGRQSRFLADIAPKFVAAAMLKTKNPIFLESVQVDGKKLNTGMIKETLKDYKSEVMASTIGMRQGFFEGTPEGAKSIGDAFDEMAKWVDEYYA